MKADATSANHFTPLHVTRYSRRHEERVSVFLVPTIHTLRSVVSIITEDYRFKACSVHIMAVRSSVSQLYKHLSHSSIPKVAAISTRHATSKPPQCQNRSMATIVPPVTQDATSSKGPTAMVFMNMGGPSTTDEVGEFLSRLFVSSLHYLRVETPLTNS